MEGLAGMSGGHEIVARRSYQSGLAAAIGLRPDLIVLDMTLPTYDVAPGEKGWKTRAFAGEEILHEIRRRKVGCPAVVLTQFESFGEGADKLTLEQLAERLDAEFGNSFLGAIYYQRSEARWLDLLRETIQWFERGDAK